MAIIERSMVGKNDKNRIFELARKWQKGIITPEEKMALDHWYESFDDCDAESFPTDYAVGVRIFDRIEHTIRVPKKRFSKK